MAGGWWLVADGWWLEVPRLNACSATVARRFHGGSAAVPRWFRSGIIKIYLTTVSIGVQNSGGGGVGRDEKYSWKEQRILR